MALMMFAGCGEPLIEKGPPPEFSEPEFSRVGVELLPTSSNSASAPAVVPEDEAKSKVSAVRAPSAPSVPTNIPLGQEAAVREFILQTEKDWNAKNIKGILGALAENAEIMIPVGKDEHKIISKEEYKKILPDLFKHGRVKCKEPEIKFIGSHGDAEVEWECVIVDNQDIWLVKKLQLIYADGSWLVKKSVYDMHWRGPGEPRSRPRDRGEELN